MADWTAARTHNAKRIGDALAPFAQKSGPIRLPEFRCGGCTGCNLSNGCHHANYKAYAYVRPANLANGWSRDRIVSEIVSRGVPCFQGSCSEVCLEKAFQENGLRPIERLPIAKELGETSLMFLVHPTLTDAEMTKTADMIAEVLTQTSKQ